MLKIFHIMVHINFAMLTTTFSLTKLNTDSYHTFNIAPFTSVSSDKIKYSSFPPHLMVALLK